MIDDDAGDLGEPKPGRGIDHQMPIDDFPLGGDEDRMAEPIYFDACPDAGNLDRVGLPDPPPRGVEVADWSGFELELRRKIVATGTALALLLSQFPHGLAPLARALGNEDLAVVWFTAEHVPRLIATCRASEMELIDPVKWN